VSGGCFLYLLVFCILTLLFVLLFFGIKILVTVRVHVSILFLLTQPSLGNINRYSGTYSSHLGIEICSVQWTELSRTPSIFNFILLPEDRNKAGFQNVVFLLIPLIFSLNFIGRSTQAKSF
jgi:hypothetical protein